MKKNHKWGPPFLPFSVEIFIFPILMRFCKKNLTIHLRNFNIDWKLRQKVKKKLYMGVLSSPLNFKILIHYPISMNFSMKYLDLNLSLKLGQNWKCSQIVNVTVIHEELKCSKVSLFSYRPEVLFVINIYKYLVNVEEFSMKL